MKFVYINPSNGGFKHAYIRLAWQFLLFLITLNISAYIYQVLQQKQCNSYDGRNSTMDIINNFSVEHNLTQDIVNNLFRDVISEDDYVGKKPLSYLEAVILTLSVFYTVGWGNVTPMTNEGKIFSIVCSCVGIPLTFIMILTASQIFIQAMECLLGYVYNCCTGRNGKRRKENHLIMIKFLIPTLIIILLMFMFASTLLMMTLGGFSIIDSVYYCFVTLATVGFGDFTPSKLMHEESIIKTIGLTIFFFLWIMFGVIIVVANFRTLFAIKLKSPEIISVSYFKDVQRKHGKIAIDSEIDKSSVCVKAETEEGSHPRLRYLFK